MDLSKCGAEGRQIDPFPQCGKYYTEGSLRKKGFIPARDGGQGSKVVSEEITLEAKEI